jgi:hypothetical protein
MEAGHYKRKRLLMKTIILILAKDGKKRIIATGFCSREERLGTNPNATRKSRRL